MAIIASLISKINQKRLEQDLFYLAQVPLPCRCLNYTLPGNSQSTLEQADDYIVAQLKAAAWPCEREAVPVQAFVSDLSVPHGFRKPNPDEPWLTAHNLYFRKPGAIYPDEWIVLCAHKDSQSWLGCVPGAYDNAVGVSGLLEIARNLAEYPSQRSILLIFCNEEHWPWTSVSAAARLAQASETIMALINLDGIGGKSKADIAQGRRVNVCRYSTDEGEKIADLSAVLNDRLGIGLEQRKHFLAQPNDDDGSFIHGGILPAVMMIGSYPFADPNYHSPNDRPEYVDLVNVKMAVQLGLATVLFLDLKGKDNL